jgi:hypothetical protein
MMEFEQQQLRQALADANVEPNEHEQKIVALAGRLRAIKQRDRARRAERAQVRDQKDLLEAILQIRNSADDILKTLHKSGEPLELVLINLKAEHEVVRDIEGVCLLRNIMEEARFYLENARHGRQQTQTDLELDLYDAYYELTGELGMGDETGEGPLYRFVKACLPLISPDLELGSSSAFRGRLNAADKRRRREITEKDVVQIEPPNLRACNFSDFAAFRRLHV